MLPPFDLKAQVCIDASRNDGFLANRIVAESLLCCQRIAVPGWLASGAALPSMARQQRMRSVIVDLLPESVTPPRAQDSPAGANGIDDRGSSSTWGRSPAAVVHGAAVMTSPIALVGRVTLPRTMPQLAGVVDLRDP